jgi:hypothetical protein
MGLLSKIKVNSWTEQLSDQKWYKWEACDLTSSLSLNTPEVAVSLELQSHQLNKWISKEYILIKLRSQMDQCLSHEQEVTNN